MAIGLIGRKVGMTRIFTEDGVSIPVTVIEATPNRVTAISKQHQTALLPLKRKTFMAIAHCK